jgi:nicotinamidase-related amidase
MVAHDYRSLTMLSLDASKTALVLIDLQHGIINMPLAPRTGADVLHAAIPLAHRFREAGAPVVLVRVTWSDDYGDVPPNLVDTPSNRPAGGMPAAFATLHESLVQPSDMIITKRQWGAFYSTELDLQLRRRGIDTVVLGGIATNYGVDSTARQAWERNYNVVIAEDVCASISSEMHEMAMQTIFPRISRVVKSADVTFGA